MSAELKPEIKTIDEGVFTGTLIEKKRKTKYDFLALSEALKAGKQYVLPAIITSESTAENIVKRLKEKKIYTKWGTAEGTKQFVFYVAPEKKVKA